MTSSKCDLEASGLKSGRDICDQNRVSWKVNRSLWETFHHIFFVLIHQKIFLADPSSLITSWTKKGTFAFSAHTQFPRGQDNYASRRVDEHAGSLSKLPIKCLIQSAAHSIGTSTLFTWGRWKLWRWGLKFPSTMTESFLQSRFPPKCPWQYFTSCLVLRASHYLWRLIHTLTRENRLT